MYLSHTGSTYQDDDERTICQDDDERMAISGHTYVWLRKVVRQLHTAKQMDPCTLYPVECHWLVLGTGWTGFVLVVLLFLP